MSESQRPDPSIVDSQKMALAESRARELEWMFFDVDGVLTDGGLFYGSEGETFKRFHVLDGHGIKALKEAGLKVGFLSGRDHPAVSMRAKELGVDFVSQGDNRKGALFDRLVKTLNLKPMQCGHMGDDSADIEVFERVGFSASVPNAPASVRVAALWTATQTGGNGAVRECCDFILDCRR